MEEVKEERPKIVKNMFIAIEHTVFYLFGKWLFYDRPWINNIEMMWDNKFDISVYVYYYCYFFRYWVQLRDLDKKKDKDYNVYMVHHIATLSLLVCSFFRYTRIGVMIALNHDISDIFLNFSKATNKLKQNAISNISLALFVYSWFKIRILMNFNILHHIFVYKQLSGFNYFTDLHLDEQASVFLLMINFSLQLFWQFLICKFVYNIIFSSHSVDEKGEKYKVV